MVSLQSEKIDLISAALALAQSEMLDVHKNAKNEYIGNRFADLAAVRAACIGPLNAHGIAVTQTFGRAGGKTRARFETVKTRNGKEYRIPTQVLGYLRTQLSHESGQWIASELAVAAAWGDPHSLGGMITYLRRYCLAAIVELAQEDDDGETAKGRQADRRPAARPTAPTPRPRAAAPNPVPPPPAAPLAGWNTVIQRDPPAPPRKSGPARSPLLNSNGYVEPKAVPAIPAPTPDAPAAKPLVEKPKTGLQFAVYISDQSIDPNLKAWILDHFSARAYPQRITDWTEAQVTAAWPDIRDHLQRMKLTAQMTATSSAAPSSATMATNGVH